MINPFERFMTPKSRCTKSVKIHMKKVKKHLGSVVDIQPYENELENRIYGLTENKNIKCSVTKQTL